MWWHKKQKKKKMKKIAVVSKQWQNTNVILPIVERQNTIDDILQCDRMKLHNVWWLV